MAISLMPVLEKLSQSNHTLWRAQVLAVLRGAQLARFLDGTNKPPVDKIEIKKKNQPRRKKKLMNYLTQLMSYGRRKSSEFLANC
jgi:hypothetical protein